ncbi:glycoside hydrolase family 43 protein [Antarcticibacterium sp. 1MA-6-2]|uniref:glycoside hydrolase family 43 protein n=1 Tax=Antarcticibacterium sp. 1MA-6-2 TaxID=2908210 RepID=UPI001F3BC1EB|nr:glycoside hydrolase family 43 protein [Antarcticibacterium sp. 1MA-6-2]UJH90748.1 glycoside hydrolase family 43 protein [Antarcticibacterium sp. 1MA-6-2]
MCFVLIAFSGSAQEKTFTNPLMPSGADPYSTYHDGHYYYTNTAGNRLVLWKTKSLADLKSAEKKTIWVPPPNTLYSKNIWAPEVHFIDNKWYVYFAADDGQNENHRMYVVENTSEDPLTDNWVFKGKLATESDKWAIDGNVFRYKDQLYMIWSGWEGNENGQQNIYIAKMRNPHEMEGERTLIAQPVNSWETYGYLGAGSNPSHVYVNEGPQFLSRGGEVFIVFSASGCWTDNYSLGLLSFDETKDLLDPSAWTKHKKPIFQQSGENEVYGPGHNSFFKSPDGTEDWLLYHANSEPGEGCGRERSPRMQKISWNKDGTPNLGIPVPEGRELPVPSEP